MAARKPRRTVARRKKPRTAAQKAATKKLVALNKRRLKARNKARRKPAPKKRPLSPAARRAVKRRKTARRKSHAYVIKVIVATPKKHTRWYTGKGFVKAADRIDHPPKRFATKEGASAECIKIAPKLPASISSIRIVKL